MHAPDGNRKNGVSFSAVVLAGGRSLRMGRDKAFLRVGNELLIERQLRCLRETGARELLISGRAGIDYSCFGATVVRDRQPGAGPLTGVVAALNASSSETVLVLAVDIPAMTSRMLLKIISLSQGGLGCVPLDEKGFQPLVAVYPRAALPLAEQYLRNGQYSMQGFVEAAIAKDLIRPLEIQPSERVCFTNWNQPSDWPESDE